MSDFDGDEDNERTQKPKKSTGTAAKLSLKKAASGSADASSNKFLTAAEQRAQTTKDEKKSQEDPFFFLLDIRDVRHISTPLLTPEVMRLLPVERWCRTWETWL